MRSYPLRVVQQLFLHKHICADPRQYQLDEVASGHKYKQLPRDKHDNESTFFGSIGTICDTSDIQRLSYNEAFKDAGLDWNWDNALYRELLTITGGKNRLQHYADRKDGQDLDSSVLQQVHIAKTTHFNQRLLSGEAKLRPGVARLIDDAKHAGIKLGFVTSTERSNVDSIDNALGSAFTLKDFDIVTTRTMVEREKPASDVYHVALKSVQCLPEFVVAVEDTQSCINAVINADIACVATPNSFSTEQDFSLANALVSHLGDADKPSVQLSGYEIIKHGLVTISALTALSKATPEI